MDTQTTQLLNAYWLRPETALWRAIDIGAMSSFEFRSPSLDFGCGDGLFSFIRAGGELAASFDAFQVTDGLNKFFEHHDVYDAFDASLAPVITASPRYQIDTAFDHKPNLLQKAATLGLYRSFAVGDGNAKLPFDDASYSSIFSNIVYWLDEPSVTLKELRRILRRDGELCLMLPDRNLLDYSFYNSLFVKTGNTRWAWLDKIDRGRLSDNIKQVRSAGEWETIFAEAGLAVTHHVRHLSKPIVQIWDIGLRPLFPLLMKMVRSVDRNDLPEIKDEWIKTMGDFVEPLLEIERLQNPEQAAFHCYILRPESR